MKKSTKKYIKNKQGFTLGEVMLATFIMLVAIGGAIIVMARSIHQIGSSRDSVIASSLAQEGVELVRNIRDNSVTQSTCGVSGSERCTAFDPTTASSTGTLYGWPSYISGANGIECYVDYNIYKNKLQCGSVSRVLYLNKELGVYTYDSTETVDDTVFKSKFKRLIYLQYRMSDGSAIPVSPTAEQKDKIIAKVTSVVMWSNEAMPSIDEVNTIQDFCNTGSRCAFVQTELTSWINYGG